MGHIHAELMMQYAEDARETERPWDRWQYLPCGQTEWEQCSIGPVWCSAWHYRRKPRTITINGREVPEPMRKATEIQSKWYFTPSILELPLYEEWTWDGCDIDLSWLSRGLCHSTKEAAIAHAEALLSFTEAK